MSKQRFEFIDALRGLAISGVIITHAASITGVEGLTRQFLNVMGMGVQLFFVISAFTIFNSLSRSPNDPNRNRDFFIKRLFRIIPVYWMGIILYTVVYGLETRGWRGGPELWHYPFHLFFVNVLHPLTSSSVVPGGWSISVEVLFYMIAPFLFVYLNTPKRIVYFMVLTLIFIPAGNLLLKSLASKTIFVGYENGVINNFFYRWPPSQFACFGFGLILFKLFKEGSYRNYIQNKTVNLALLSFVTIGIFTSFMLPSLVQKHHVVSFLFMCGALLLSVIPWKILVNKITVFIGKISYSSYLIHFLVIYQSTLFIESQFPEITSNTYLYFVIVAVSGFVFTIPLAYLGYLYIEQPAVSWGRKLIEYLNNTKSGKVQENAVKLVQNDRSNTP